MKIGQLPAAKFNLVTVLRVVARLMKHTEHVHIPDATLQQLGSQLKAF